MYDQKPLNPQQQQESNRDKEVDFTVQRHVNSEVWSQKGDLGLNKGNQRQDLQVDGWIPDGTKCNAE